MMTMRCSTAQTISRLQRLVKKEEEGKGKAMDGRTDERRTIQRGYAPLGFVNRRWKSAPAAAAPAAPSSAEMMSAAKD